MNNKTELVVILDKSGSMHEMTEDTIGGFNSVIEEQKKIEGEVFVTTYLFNDHADMIHDRLPIGEVPNMDRNTYSTSGCTALVDAIGEAVEHIEGIHKYARKEDIPQHTIFLITTDGLENASHKYSSADVKKKISVKQEEGWEFIYVAANIDAVDTARDIGIRESRAVNYRNDTAGNRLKFEAMNKATRTVRASMSLDECTSWRDDLDKDYKTRGK